MPYSLKIYILKKSVLILNNPMHGNRNMRFDFKTQPKNLE